MGRIKIFFIPLLSLAVCFSGGFPAKAAEAEKFIQVPALIQISSRVSDGRFTLSEVVERAKKSGYKIIIFTDRDVMRWEYGLWPLRNLIKKTVENNSISMFGIKRYLNEIKELRQRNPEVILIAGIETAAFYYWSGSIFKHDFKLNDGHKHMLVFGLEDINALKQLPSIGNYRALYLPFRLKDISRLWPIGLLVIGFSMRRKKQEYYKRRKKTGYFPPTLNFYGWIFMLTGLIFSINNFPFRECLFDQYHGYQGSYPYQNLIDYVQGKGGLSFWSHPEAEYNIKTSQVEVVTREHTEDFLKTQGYTGFVIFYEGYNKIGKPGGLWDKVLMEYLEGKRKKPVWAIGGLAFDYYGNLEERFQDLQNILLVKQFDKKGVLEALSSGKVYVVKGGESAQIILDKFVVCGASADTDKTMGMGEVLLLKANLPMIEARGYFNPPSRNSGGQGLAEGGNSEENSASARFSPRRSEREYSTGARLARRESKRVSPWSFKENKGKTVQIKLIRNGVVIKTFEENCPFQLQYQDNGFADKAYYRLEIISRGIHLITNPVFVKKVNNR